MSQIRVREKHQITLPMAIVRGAGIRESDLLDVQYKNGVILLIPHKNAASQQSLMDFVGSTPGLYGADGSRAAQYLSNERDSWDR
jgi:bifunctional DNA-binding transcriptional regulator/antitoxin component of YhaV-PrlF toxin-antitoxin module